MLECCWGAPLWWQSARQLVRPQLQIRQGWEGGIAPRCWQCPSEREVSQDQDGEGREGSCIAPL